MLSNKIHKTYNFQIQPAKCFIRTRIRAWIRRGNIFDAICFTAISDHPLSRANAAGTYDHSRHNSTAQTLTSLQQLAYSYWRITNNNGNPLFLYEAFKKHL